MLDVLIVGAGPAGSVAAAVLARAGARVRIVDRAVFPRDKLCGDTVNPGTLATLSRLGLARAIDACGLPVEGMCLTGANGATVEGRYPHGLIGRALLRRHFDWMLLQDAVAAGAQFESGVAVRRAACRSGARGRRARGRLWMGVRHARARDDRRRRPALDPRFRARPCTASGAAPPLGGRRVCRGRRTTTSSQTLGEMHVRPGHYIGIAPVPGGLTNVCVVKPWRPGDRAFGDPREMLRRELARDPLLRDRFAGARVAGPTVVLGPLAVDVRPCTIEGLLLAGDAAGFVDPMTGDGLCFAVRGAELAAQAALAALEHGWHGVHDSLAYSAGQSSLASGDSTARFARLSRRRKRSLSRRPAPAWRPRCCGAPLPTPATVISDGADRSAARPDLPPDAHRGVGRGAQRARPARARWRRAARRRVSDHARRVSGGVRGDDRGGRVGSGSRVVGHRARGVCRGEGAQVVGDRSLGPPGRFASSCGRAFGSWPAGRTGCCAIRTTWRSWANSWAWR